jgi:hypothetical protein
VLPVAFLARFVTDAPAVVIAWVVPLGTAVVISYIAWSSRNVRFELSPEGLHIRRSLFGRLVPRADLLPEQGCILSLREQPRMKPFVRTWGSGLVGYREGWFRLRNWDKALIFLTDPTSVVDLPTRRGYRLLLSVADPQQFLDDAQRIWRSPAPVASPTRFRAAPLEPR